MYLFGTILLIRQLESDGDVTRGEEEDEEEVAPCRVKRWHHRREKAPSLTKNVKQWRNMSHKAKPQERNETTAGWQCDKV